MWGPSHGGANEAVLKMLEEIGTVERTPLYLAKAKDKAAPFRLMGFGHRVYKNFDPRATLMRKVRVLRSPARKRYLLLPRLRLFSPSWQLTALHAHVHLPHLCVYVHTARCARTSSQLWTRHSTSSCSSPRSSRRPR